MRIGIGYYVTCSEDVTNEQIEDFYNCLYIYNDPKLIEIAERVFPTKVDKTYNDESKREEFDYLSYELKTTAEREIEISCMTSKVMKDSKIKICNKILKCFVRYYGLCYMRYATNDRLDISWNNWITSEKYNCFKIYIIDIDCNDLNRFISELKPKMREIKYVSLHILQPIPLRYSVLFLNERYKKLFAHTLEDKVKNEVSPTFDFEYWNIWWSEIKEEDLSTTYDAKEKYEYYREKEDC